MQLGLSSFRGAQLQTPQPIRRAADQHRLQIVALKPIQGKVVSTSMAQTAVVQVIHSFVARPFRSRKDLLGSILCVEVIT